MSCEDLTNVLAAVLFVSFLFNVVLATVVRCQDNYDDPIGESLLRDGELSMVNLNDSDEDDVVLGNNGVLLDPYAVLPPDYHFNHVRERDGAVESVLSRPHSSGAEPPRPVPSESNV